MSSRKKSVTMRDVAKHAGVSVKTVSNVVNDWPYVSTETREKVWDAIKEVGYRPNHLARSLVTGKSKSIGIVVPDISNPFFGTVIRGTEESLLESDFNYFLCNTNENEERERYYLELLLSRGVDALILWGTRLNTQELIEIIGEEIPFVTVDLEDNPISENHTNINVDSVEGAREATNHLINQGYQKIAHIQGPEGRSTSDRRLLGYSRALKDANKEVEGALIKSERPSIRGGYRATLDLMENQQPDAIFCYNDLMSIGALLAARQKSVDVPSQVALVGFDDIVMASIANPPLTTISIDQYKLGKLTGKTVLSHLIEEKAEPDSSILFPVELKVRDSSGQRTLSNKQKSEMFEKIVNSLYRDLNDSQI